MSGDIHQAPGGFAAGSRISGYLLEEQIGQGGMAVVFRAHDERLDRTVALKILAPALADDQAFRQRFIRESRAAAAVDDPHIIPVFEAGEAAGVLFIAMRYVRGGDARSLLTRTGPLPVGRVAEIVSQVASALDAAHARGLVHRDVKPANMLLDASGGAGRPDHVYLSDFGLSKAALQSSGLTGTGTFLGTLDYVAPEQIEGKPVDGRADEYALACAAFELLAGTAPFARSEAMAVMYAQLSEAPPALSAQRRGLPAALDPVLIRALAKAPADRYPTCREFAEALREACGLRPYDSGPTAVPTDHPVTQVAWAAERTKLAEAASGGTQLAGAPGGTELAGAAAAADAGGTARAREPGAAVSGEETQAIFARRGAVPEVATAGQQVPSGGYPDGRRRPRWRSPGALAVALVIVLALGAGGAYAALHGKAGGGASASSGGGPGGGGGQPPPVGGLAPPPCSQTAATASFVNGAQTAYPVPNNGMPFGVVASPDSKFVFAVTATTLEVYGAGSGLTLTHLWNFTIATPALPAAGITITHDGQHLLVAAGNGIDVLSVETAETDSGTLLLGTMTVPGITGYGRAINVAVTPTDIFAFVTLQFRGQLAVFNLGNAIANGAFSSSFVGSVPLGGQPVGVTVSPDGAWLYATSFAAHQPGANEGSLAVLKVAQLEANPASTTIDRVTAGCSPARIVVSPGSPIVWVTARDSNFLLGFSAVLLRSNPKRALVAKVQVGQSPIGLALVNGGTRMIIADTDVHETGANNLAVVNITKALAGKPGALLGYLHSGLLPHEMALVPGGKFVVVSDNGAAQLEVINVSKLP